jgi:hypothetical protein
MYKGGIDRMNERIYSVVRIIDEVDHASSVKDYYRPLELLQRKEGVWSHFHLVEREADR